MTVDKLAAFGTGLFTIAVLLLLSRQSVCKYLSMKYFFDKDCSVNQAFPSDNQDITKFIVGDCTFHLCDYLVKPYSMRFLSVVEGGFNYRCSRGQRVVKNTDMLACWQCGYSAFCLFMLFVFPHPGKSSNAAWQCTISCAFATHKFRAMILTEKMTTMIFPIVLGAMRQLW